MSKEQWVIDVAWMALHQMSWDQLRATVVHEPARRTEAWRRMLARSAMVEHCSESIKTHGRNHGG